MVRVAARLICCFGPDQDISTLDAGPCTSVHYELWMRGGGVRYRKELAKEKQTYRDHEKAFVMGWRSIMMDLYASKTKRKKHRSRVSGIEIDVGQAKAYEQPSKDTRATCDLPMCDKTWALRMGC